MKGLFESTIDFNFIDKKNSLFYKFFRDYSTVLDNNMFVTNFVLYSMLDTYSAGLAPLDEQVFHEALDALLIF